MTAAERSAQVADLLDELEQIRRRLYVARAHGVQPAGLRGLEADLAETRRRLSAVS